jgi:CHAD domain-containing protein
MLGEWRNCDVLLDLVSRQQRRTRSDLKKQAWELVREHLLQTREKQVARVGKKLPRQDLVGYAALARALTGRPPHESPEILIERLCGSVQRAWTKWQSVLARAEKTRAVNDLHAFRVATKDLRYRTELLYDLGHKELKPQLKWLEELQDRLGIWHDRQVLNEAVARALARPELLLNELAAVRMLLTELEKDRSRQAQDGETILRLATEHPGRKEMESWGVNPSRLTPHPSRNELGVKREQIEVTAERNEVQE